MKYTDYYAALGVERGASSDEIRKAYRRLAQKYHPDVSKDADAEAKFKEIAEAYQTLKDPEKRAAYDQLGAHAPGEEIRPPPEWGRQFGGSSFSFDDVDLSDLFSRFGAGPAGGGPRRGGGMPGQDFEVAAEISIEDAYRGTTLELNLQLTEYDPAGRPRRVPHKVKARIAPGAIDGQRLRLPGKGGKGAGGARDGDLYLNITLRPHPLYRAIGHDLYLDLPLSPAEAALGAVVEVPTLAGKVNLKVPPGTSGGQKLRLAARGLPKPRGGAGDLFAVAQIVLPPKLSEREKELYRQLADATTTSPREHFGREVP